MAEASHLQTQIFEAFGTTNLYEILKVDRLVSANEIKKAYRKLALLHHPDKGGSAKQFQGLSVAHSILSDPEKRKAYDKNGFLDDEESSKDYDFWYEYFRNLFPTLTVGAMDEFSSTYKGSNEEIDDVRKEYIKYKGDFAKIMESVMLAEDGDEDRIANIIDALIGKGDIESLPKFKSSLEKVKKSRKRKQSSKKGGKDSEEDLIVAIQSKKRGGTSSSSAAAMTKLLSKYGGGDESEEPDISDEAFEAARARVLSKKKK